MVLRRLRGAHVAAPQRPRAAMYGEGEAVFVHRSSAFPSHLRLPLLSLPAQRRNLARIFASLSGMASSSREHRAVMPALSTTAQEARSGLRGRLRLVLVGLGISVVPLDTAVNIGFPDITGSFGLPIAMIQWVIICYVLTHAGLMLALGRAGDIWGHARVFRAGLLWSGGAFLLCAAAPSFGWLLFSRFLQGIGAGLVISCAPALVTALYPEARRSHALGIFTLMFALGSASGPIIGGALVAQFGWPSVFWFRAPIALLSLALLRGLPAHAKPVAGERFDIVGALLLALGLAGLLFAINALRRLLDGDYLGLLLVPAAAASLAFFVWWEGHTRQPIIRIELFRNARFALVNAAGCAMNFSAFSVMLIGPYFLVRYTGLSVPSAGLVLASGFVAMAANSLLAGGLVARLGAVRVGPLGALLTGGGLCSVAFWSPDTAPLLMVLALVLHGIGMSSSRLPTWSWYWLRRRSPTAVSPAACRC